MYHCSAVLGSTLLLLGGEGGQSEDTAETVPGQSGEGGWGDTGQLYSGGEIFSLRNPGAYSCSVERGGEVVMVAGYGSGADEGHGHVDRFSVVLTADS